MKKIKRGDYFLLPYAGSRRERLICAVRPTLYGGAQWYAAKPGGGPTIILLSSCARCGPALAKKLLGKS